MARRNRSLALVTIAPAALQLLVIVTCAALRASGFESDLLIWAPLISLALILAGAFTVGTVFLFAPRRRRPTLDEARHDH